MIHTKFVIVSVVTHNYYIHTFALYKTNLSILYRNEKSFNNTVEKMSSARKSLKYRLHIIWLAIYKTHDLLKLDFHRFILLCVGFRESFYYFEVTKVWDFLNGYIIFSK